MRNFQAFIRYTGRGTVTVTPSTTKLCYSAGPCTGEIIDENEVYGLKIFATVHSVENMFAEVTLHNDSELSKNCPKLPKIERL